MLGASLGPAVLSAGLYYQIFRTQCFTSGDGPATTLSEAAPATHREAVKLLELHHRQHVPVVFRNGSAMHGWSPSNCWSTECLRDRFGQVAIEGGYMATLEDYLDTFFDGEDPPLLKENCLKGDEPPCSIQAGAPFCTRPCMINATLNFGIVDDSDPPFEDVLEDTLSSLPLLRARSQRGDSWAARLVTWLVPSTVGFAPEADWVEAVLWLSPAGARTGLHQDDEPCSILYQVHGRKRILLFSPKHTEHLKANERPHCLGEHGTRYSKLSWEEIQTLEVIKPLEVVLEAGDAIFIPNSWWHSVEALGPGPAVSISGRAVTFCEGISFLPFWVAILLQQTLLMPEDQAIWLPHLLAIALPLVPSLVLTCVLQCCFRRLRSGKSALEKGT